MFVSTRVCGQLEVSPAGDKLFRGAWFSRSFYPRRTSLLASSLKTDRVSASESRAALFFILLRGLFPQVVFVGVL